MELPQVGDIVIYAYTRSSVYNQSGKAENSKFIGEVIHNVGSGKDHLLELNDRCSISGGDIMSDCIEICSANNNIKGIDFYDFEEVLMNTKVNGEFEIDAVIASHPQYFI